jgi:hypothetical protein
MTELEPTQRTRFWRDVVQLNAMVVTVGILGLLAVWSKLPALRWASGASAVMFLAITAWLAWRFRRRYEQTRAVR